MVTDTLDAILELLVSSHPGKYIVYANFSLNIHSVRYQLSKFEKANVESTWQTLRFCKIL